MKRSLLTHLQRQVKTEADFTCGMKANKVIVKMSTDANSLDVAQVEPKMRPHRLKMFQQYFINIQLREEIEDRPEKCFLRSVKADAQSLCTLLSTANICAGNEDKQRIHKRMWDVGSLYYTKMHSEVLQESETQTNKSKTCPNLNWDRLDRYSGNIYLVGFFFCNELAVSVRLLMPHIRFSWTFSVE